jgi:hypothetical protein
MRLTVVTACGMVGTVVTGVLGMNLFAQADLPDLQRLWIFTLVFALTTALAVYTVVISRRLATFMEALSSDALDWGEKLVAFRQIWTNPRRTRRRKQRAAGEDERLRGTSRQRAASPGETATSSD